MDGNSHSLAAKRDRQRLAKPSASAGNERNAAGKLQVSTA